MLAQVPSSDNYTKVVLKGSLGLCGYRSVVVRVSTRTRLVPKANFVGLWLQNNSVKIRVHTDRAIKIISVHVSNIGDNNQFSCPDMQREKQLILNLSAYKDSKVNDAQHRSVSTLLILWLQSLGAMVPTDLLICAASLSRASGLQVFRLQVFRLQDFRSSDFRSLGLQGFRTSGLQVFRTSGPYFSPDTSSGTVFLSVVNRYVSCD